MASNASSASRFARSPIACTPTGQPALRRPANDLRELLAARDPDAGAVEHPRGLGAERPVHEHLQVAEPEEVVAEAGADTERVELRQLLVRERLPDPKGQPSAVPQALEDLGRPDPAVLVVHGRDAPAVRELHAGTRDVQPLVLGDGGKPLTKAPRGLLAQHAGRFAILVALDDSAFGVEIPLCEGECRRVQPQRVQILRPERGRSVTCGLVERVLRRLSIPFRRAPALPADPRASPLVSANPLECVRERPDAVEAQITLCERPGRKVDVRVVEARDDAPAADIDHLGGRQGRLVDTDSACDPLTRDRERASDGKRRIHCANDAVF